MSTDCENLLKRFLVLNPMKRGVLTNIMNDKWININYEQDNLTPYKEPDLFNALAEDRVGKFYRLVGIRLARFLAIFQFLEEVLKEHIETVCSSTSQLFFDFIRSIRISSTK